MPVINVAPVTWAKYGLKIGTDNYEKHVDSVTLTPTTPVSTFKGAGDGQVDKSAGKADWKLDLNYAQDWSTTNSLSIYLLNNIGQTKAVEFFPLGAGPKFAANVLIVPGAVGGKIDDSGTASVTLEIVGQPVFTAGA